MKYLVQVYVIKMTIAMNYLNVIKRNSQKYVARRQIYGKKFTQCKTNFEKTQKIYKSKTISYK